MASIPVFLQTYCDEYVLNSDIQYKSATQGTIIVVQKLITKKMNQPKRYLITSALPYANGLKHVGHLAGAYLPADIYARYLRAQKRDVVFVCGSDEHGTAIPIQAKKEGTTAQAIIDKYHVAMKQDFEELGMSWDIYHRTSSPLHHETDK